MAHSQHAPLARALQRLHTQLLIHLAQSWAQMSRAEAATLLDFPRALKAASQHLRDAPR